MDFVKELTIFASKLDNEELSLVADSVDAIAANFIKVAQYVGSQEYWIRNERCWSNCYRQKRSSSPSKPAQEVWMECQSEYQKQLNDTSDTWDKYASSPNNIKFAELIKNTDNDEVDNAIAETITFANQEHHNKLITASYDMLLIAEDLDHVDHKLAVEAARISAEMQKEAGWWDNTKDMGKSMLQGVKDQFYAPPGGSQSPGAGQSLWGRYRANQNLRDQQKIKGLQDRSQRFQDGYGKSAPGKIPPPPLPGTQPTTNDGLQVMGPEYGKKAPADPMESFNVDNLGGYNEQQLSQGIQALQRKLQNYQQNINSLQKELQTRQNKANFQNNPQSAASLGQGLDGIPGMNSLGNTSYSAPGTPVGMAPAGAKPSVNTNGKTFTTEDEANKWINDNKLDGKYKPARSSTGGFYLEQITTASTKRNLFKI